MIVNTPETPECPGFESVTDEIGLSISHGKDLESIKN